MASPSSAKVCRGSMLELLLQDDKFANVWVHNALDVMHAEEDKQINRIIENEIQGRLDDLSCVLKRTLLVCVLINNTEFQLRILRREQQLKEGSRPAFLRELSELYTAYSEGNFDEEGLQTRAVDLYKKHVTKDCEDGNGGGSGARANLQ